MIHRIAGLVASIAAATLLSFTASAMVSCQPRAGLIKQLEKNFQEVPRARGLRNSGSMVEVLWSKNGSWTMVVTYPSGISCIAYAGVGWELTPVPLPPKI